NGSARYSASEIAEKLLGVRGIAKVAVASWPYIYGATDTAVLINPFYTLFLQVSAMSVALRRYAAFADGLLNCDIDELAATPDTTTIFELARRAPRGLVVMPGQFIEAIPGPGAPAEA